MLRIPVSTSRPQPQQLRAQCSHWLPLGYNQQYQQNQDQTNVNNAMNGVAGTPYGAGLANLLFCRPGTRVFELRSHQGNWNSLEATSVALGQRFIAVPQPVPPPGMEPFLDVDMILKTVAA